jgi:hypothetical protein
VFVSGQIAVGSGRSVRQLDRGRGPADAGDSYAGRERDLREQAEPGDPGAQRADAGRRGPQPTERPGTSGQPVGEDERELAARQRWAVRDERAQLPGGSRVHLVVGPRHV